MNVKVNFDVAVGISAIMMLIATIWSVHDTRVAVEEVKVTTDHKIDKVLSITNDTNLSNNEIHSYVKKILKEVK